MREQIDNVTETIYMSSFSANDYDVTTATTLDIGRHSAAEANRVASSIVLMQRLDQSRQVLLQAEKAYALARKRYECGQLSALALRNAASALIRWRATVTKLQSRA